ncbi:MAG: DUF5591 domain-containing protein [Ignisphaera sp.]
MSAIVKMYIDYLYQELGKDLVEQIIEIPPGVKILKNGIKNLFEHPHVVLWHNFLLSYFDPKVCGKPYAIIMPCSSIKPYRLSPTHKILDSLLIKNGVTDYVQVYILSEPMILVPRELDIYYPFANYEYPVQELTPQYREKFIELLSAVLPKLKYHRKIVVVLPKHHLSVFWDSLERVGGESNVIIIEYGRKAFQSVKTAAVTVINYVKTLNL